MADAPREAWITGVGIVSCLGEGGDAHWQKLMEGKPNAETSAFSPFVVHPIAPINFDSQIPKKGDQRQMEPWQRIGTYAAGLALDSAGVKGKPDILSRTDMIVAAGGGERDLNVDSTILSGMPHAANSAAFLNEKLMGDLRPTLFLAQLSICSPATSRSYTASPAPRARSWARNPPALTRYALPCRASLPVKAISPSSAARITANVPIC